MSALESTVITMESWMIMLVVARVVMVVVMLMVAGEWTRHMAARSEECHSRNCTSCTPRSAIVGTEGVL